MTQTTPRYIPKMNENMHTHSYLYTNIYSHIIYKIPKVETIQMSTNLKCDIAIQWNIFSHKNVVLLHGTTWRSFKATALSS
jgi:hypothetical protein